MTDISTTCVEVISHIVCNNIIGLVNRWSGVLCVVSCGFSSCSYTKLSDKIRMKFYHFSLGLFRFCSNFLGHFSLNVLVIFVLIKTELRRNLCRFKLSNVLLSTKIINSKGKLTATSSCYDDKKITSSWLIPAPRKTSPVVTIRICCVPPGDTPGKRQTNTQTCKYKTENVQNTRGLTS